MATELNIQIEKRKLLISATGFLTSKELEVAEDELRCLKVTKRILKL